LRTPKHTIFPCLNHSSDGLGPSEYFPDTKTHDLSISYQVHNFYVYKEKARIGGHLQRKKTHLQQKQEHLSDNPAFNSREKRNYLYMTTKLFKRKKKVKRSIRTSWPLDEQVRLSGFLGVLKGVQRKGAAVGE
jgi:hypothetical protein